MQLIADNRLPWPTHRFPQENTWVYPSERRFGDWPFDPAYPQVDPQIPYAPLDPWVPLVPEYDPYFVRPTNSAISTIFAVRHGWRLTYEADAVIAKVDIPGVKVDDVTLKLYKGVLSVAARRSESGLGIVAYDCTIGSDYDPKTAQALLEDGVLTVTIKKFIDDQQSVHNITVVKK